MGTKLLPYDRYFQEERARLQYERIMRKIKKDDYEETDEAKILKEKQRKEQIEMEKKAKRKEAMANKFSFMQAKAIDKYAIE